jgi:hypothetical protein
MFNRNSLQFKLLFGLMLLSAMFLFSACTETAPDEEPEEEPVEKKKLRRKKKFNLLTILLSSLQLPAPTIQDYLTF